MASAGKRPLDNDMRWEQIATYYVERHATPEEAAAAMYVRHKGQITEAQAVLYVERGMLAVERGNQLDAMFDQQPGGRKVSIGLTKGKG